MLGMVRDVMIVEVGRKEDRHVNIQVDLDLANKIIAKRY